MDSEKPKAGKQDITNHRFPANSLHFISWATGFIEARSSINLNVPQKTLSIEVSLRFDNEVLSLLSSFFGGAVYEVSGGPVRRWVITNNAAVIMLNAMRPFFQRNRKDIEQKLKEYEDLK